MAKSKIIINIVFVYALGQELLFLIFCGDYQTCFWDYQTFWGDYQTFFGDYQTFWGDYQTFLGDYQTFLGDYQTFAQKVSKVSAKIIKHLKSLIIYQTFGPGGSSYSRSK